MNFSTTPPYRPITVRATAKYSDSNSRTASGSRDSDSGVNPTRSQNSTEHTRRSATGPPATAAPGGADVVTGEAGTISASACPHAWQNRLPAITGSPHAGQPPAGAPQFPQNLWPSPRDAPHRAHLSTRHLYPGHGAAVHSPATVRGPLPPAVTQRSASDLVRSAARTIAQTGRARVRSGCYARTGRRQQGDIQPTVIIDL